MRSIKYILRYQGSITQYSCLKISFVVLLSSILCISCSSTKNIGEVILKDNKNFYFIDARKYPVNNSALPIGIFDSGTGGLSVLNDLLDFKVTDYNPAFITPTALETHPLRNESWVFLADMANMPYGSYSIENNVGLLIEHILKNVQFLLGDKYYKSARSPDFSTDKNHIKAIVIACNTATAYGLDTIKNFLKRAGLDIGVIGVIDAGAQGAFGNFSPHENGSIAIVATDGTVKSGAYLKAIGSFKKKIGQQGNVRLFQQAGVGIAEAIDENIDFIDRSASAPRNNYKGPSDSGTGEMKIDLSALGRYRFDMGNGSMLYEGEITDPHNLQINSVENYISFHLVSLLEKIKKTEDPQVLNSLVLACTHYPFFEETFRKTISRLRDLQENGEYVYRSLIAEDLIIVNPARILADQLYTYLTERNLLNQTDHSKNEFFISVPNVLNKRIILRKDGSFTYDYKYGRRTGKIQEYVKCVPFSRSSVPEDILRRLSVQVPLVYEEIVKYNHQDPQTEYLKEKERIVKEF